MPQRKRLLMAFSAAFRSRQAPTSPLYPYFCYAMRPVYHFFCALALLLLCAPAWGQPVSHSLSNLRCLTLVLDSTPIDLSSRPLIPSSLIIIRLPHDTIASPTFVLDSTHTKLRLGAPCRLGDTLSLCYRVFPFPLARRFSPTSSQGGKLLWQTHNPQSSQTASALGRVPLELHGYFNRQMGAGEMAQGGSSGSMNLRLSGRLPNGLEIEGQIIDRALPFQPAGTSTELSQVERVYLRVADSAWQVEAGDINLLAPRGALLAYSYAVQGLGLHLTPQIDAPQASYAHALVGLAKGIPQTAHLTASAGIQGPYRLQGEREFLQIMVLAGTERVYLDGRLLARGRQADYIIDYNLGEIRFTARCPISGTSRIRVEYQALNQRFPKVISSGHAQVAWGAHWAFALRAFSAYDVGSRVSGVDREAVQHALRNSPPGEREIWVSDVAKSIDGSRFEGYRREQKTVDGKRYTIYRHVPPGVEDSLYAPSFSYVGLGQGDYILTQGNSNSQIYQWVAPKHGIQQGDYAVGYRLAAPQTHNVVEGALSYQAAGFNTQLRSAYSYLNTNPLQKDGGEKSHGFAAQLDHAQRIAQYSTDGLHLIAKGRYVGNNYLSPQDFLPVDFYRPWGLRPFSPGQAWGDASLGLRSVSQYGQSELLADAILHDHAQGIGLQENLAYVLGLYSIQGKGTHRVVNESQGQIAVQQGELRFARRLGEYQLALTGQANQRSSTHSSAESLAMDYAWWHAGVEAQRKDTIHGSWHASLIYRADRKTAQAHYSPIAQSLKGNAAGSHLWAKGAILNYALNIEWPLALRIDGKPSDWTVLLAQLSSEIPLWKKRIRLRAETGLSSEYAARMQFHYVRVPMGEGQYQWLDSNHDGVQQIDEFVKSLYPDQANYVLQMLPSSEGLRTYSRQQTLGVYLSPRPNQAPISSATSWLYRWECELQGTLQEQRAANGWDGLIAATTQLQDTALVELSASANARLWYNRDAEPLVALYSYHSAIGKALLPQGEEYSRSQAHTISVMTPDRPGLGARADAEYEHVQRAVPFSQLEGIAFPRWHTKLSILWQGDGAHTHTLYGDYTRISPQLETTKLYSIGYLATLPVGNRWEGNANLRYARMLGAKSLARNPLAYSYVEGMAAGANYLLSLSLSYKISRSLLASFSYSLRKLGDSPTHHAGFLRLSARFN